MSTWRYWLQWLRVLIMSFVYMKTEDKFKHMKRNKIFLKMLRAESSPYKGHNQSRKLLLQQRVNVRWYKWKWDQAYQQVLSASDKGTSGCLNKLGHQLVWNTYYSVYILYVLLQVHWQLSLHDDLVWLLGAHCATLSLPFLSRQV